MKYISLAVLNIVQRVYYVWVRAMYKWVHARAAPRIWRWGVNALESGWGGGVSTVKTLKFEKGGVPDHPPPSSYGVATPGCMGGWAGVKFITFYAL